MPGPSPRTILLVDDDPITRHATALFLHEVGFEVSEATTGAEALRLARAQPELILLDVQLPDLCGFEVCRSIKASPATASIPVILVSGVARTSADRTHGLEGGADGYLVKPVDPAELAAQVRALLRLRRAEEAARAGEERLRLILHTTYDAFVAIDDGGVVVEWNRQAEATFGWSREQALGCGLAELVIPPRCRHRHRLGMARLLQTGDSPVLNRLFEVTALRRDGHEFPAEVRISVVHWGGGYLFNAFVRDVTDRKRAERHQAVQQAVSQVLVQSGSVAEATRGILRAVGDITGSEAGAVWRVDREANVLRCVEFWSAAHLDVAEFEGSTRRLSLAPGEGLPGRAWLSRQPAFVAEVAREPHFCRREAARRAGLCSVFVSPVCFGREVMGVLEFYSRRVRPPDDLLALLGTPTGQIGHFLERRRAEESREEQVRLAAFGSDVALALTRPGGLDAMLRHCAEATVRHLGVAFARVWVLDPEADELVLWASVGADVPRDGGLERIPVGRWKIGQIALERRPLLTNDVPHDPDVGDPEWARAEGVIALAGHPLLLGGELVGVMAVYGRQPLSDFTRRALASAADHLAAGIRRKQAEQALRANAEEFRVARRIQQYLFPRRGPEVAGFDVGGASYPAEATGGDYFDYLRLRDGALGVTIGDVSGHGLGAALLMASTRAYLRVLAGIHDDVSEMLTFTNRILCTDCQEQFVTLLLARLEARTASLLYSSAGHPTGYLLNGEGRLKRRLKSTGMPLGVLPENTFPAAETVVLEPGDFVLLLTDGVLEARAPDGGLFGEDRALAVARVYRTDSALEMVANLYGAVRAFTLDAPLHDDVSALVIKRAAHPAPPAN